MKWTVTRRKTVDKQVKKISNKVLLLFNLLVEDLEQDGPDCKDWPNYSKLKGQNADNRHCHLKKGKPTYVCCWEVIDKERRLIEVYYVGTHENCPY